MEHTNIELTSVEQVVAGTVDALFVELDDLQLTFVGGGVGEITPY